MRKRYTAAEINSLINLRKEGKSILELIDITGIPKTTIWHHVHKIILNPDVAKKLRSQSGGSHKRSLKKWNEARLLSIKLLHGEYSQLTKCVAMLYWAEGHKKAFGFTNTDSEMLKMFLTFLKLVLKVNKTDITVLIRTSDPIDSEQSLLYWSKMLELPLSALSNNHDNKQNKTKTKFGICRVLVKKSAFHHKVIISLIDEVKKEVTAPIV